MRWIKHLSTSWYDEKVARAVGEGGLEIYGLYWRILEIIGAQMNGSPKTDCQYSAKIWGKYSGISAKKFQKLANILEEKKLIILEMNGEEININVPKLSKYRDEWSLRKNRENAKTLE